MFELLVIDCETNCVDEPEVIEFSAHKFDIHSSTREVVINNVRYKPSKPIQFGAMATHHILCQATWKAAIRLQTAGYLIANSLWGITWILIGRRWVRRKLRFEMIAGEGASSQGSLKCLIVS